MLYLKISQRYLAIILTCLLLTIAGVGVLFLIYFFNENPFTVNSVQLKTEKYDILLPQNLKLNPNDLNAKQGTKSINRKDMVHMLDIPNEEKEAMAIHRIVDDEEDTSSFESENEEDISQENIYIDDLDKSIIVDDERTTRDFTNQKVKEFRLQKFVNVKPKTKQTPISFSNNLNIKHKDKLKLKRYENIDLEQRFSDLDKLYDNIATDIGDEELDLGEQPSGSGHFNVSPFDWSAYDTVPNDKTRFLKRIKLKILRSYENIPHENSQHIKQISSNTQQHKRNKYKKKKSKKGLNMIQHDYQNSTKLQESTTDPLPYEPDPFPETSKSKGSKLRPFTEKEQTNFDRVVQSTTTFSIWEQPSNKEFVASSSFLLPTKTPQIPTTHVQMSMSPAWLETRTRRIIGNVKKSEERSRQLLLCEKEEAGGAELCRMLFKGYLNE